MSTVDKNRKRFEEDENLKYAVCEQSWYDEQTMAMKKHLGGYQSYLIIVPDFFFGWVNTERYLLDIAPNAQMFVDEYGHKYVMDADKGEGYTLQRVGEDAILGTTADYWIKDKKDVRLTKIVNEFAAEMGRAINAIGPKLGKSDEKRGPGRPKKDEAEKQAAEPGTPEYVKTERKKILQYYYDIVSKRYHDFAGYNKVNIIKEIKTVKMNEALEKSIVMNDVKSTGHLLPCINGVYDFRKKEFRSAVAADYISIYAPTTYVEGATDPEVDKFLSEFTCGRKDLCNYLAQFLGVALDVSMITRKLLQLWGPKTTNGKSTLVKALMATLGSSEKHGLAVQLPDNAIALGKNANDDSKITPSLAMIGDSKVMFVAEPKRGLRVDWALVKRLTGGDVVQVNAKYKDEYNLQARATMIIDTNHTLRVDDGTVFDRGTIKIAPCDLDIPESKQDSEIDARLSTESAKSAWLWWMIAGHEQYVDNGKVFFDPLCVQEAILQNKLESDRIAMFLADQYKLTKDHSKKVKITDLWEEYKQWCDENSYDHYGLRPDFRKYFKIKEKTYTIGKLGNQDAICGLVKAPKSALAQQPVITGDPVDWYINNHMTADRPDNIGEVPLVTIHGDYKRKVEAAGGTAMDIGPLYGTLTFKGWTVTMGAPGVTEEIMVSGWHIKTDKEREEERDYRFKLAKDNLEQAVNDTMNQLDDDTRNAINMICNAGGLDALLVAAGEDVRKVITRRLLTGKGLDRVLGDVAANNPTERCINQVSQAATIATKPVETPGKSTSKDDDIEKLKTTDAVKFLADHMAVDCKNKSISFNYFDLCKEDVQDAPTDMPDGVESKDKVAACLSLLQERGQVTGYREDGVSYYVKWA